MPFFNQNRQRRLLLHWSYKERVLIPEVADCTLHTAVVADRIPVAEVDNHRNCRKSYISISLSRFQPLIMER